MTQNALLSPLLQHIWVLAKFTWTGQLCNPHHFHDLIFVLHEHRGRGGSCPQRQPISSYHQVPCTTSLYAIKTIQYCFNTSFLSLSDFLMIQQKYYLFHLNVILMDILVRQYMDICKDNQCHTSQARILALPAQTDLPQFFPTGTDLLFIKLLFLELLSGLMIRTLNWDRWHLDSCPAPKNKQSKKH